MDIILLENEYGLESDEWIFTVKDVLIHDCDHFEEILKERNDIQVEFRYAKPEKDNRVYEILDWLRRRYHSD
jgi:hypothetical protein